MLEGSFRTRSFSFMRLYDRPWFGFISKTFAAGAIDNTETYALLLQEYGNHRNLSHGKQTHASILRIGLGSDMFLKVALINMYGKCGIPEVAWGIFEGLLPCKTVAWNTMVAAYCQNGYQDEAIFVFWLMQFEGIKHSRITFITVLKACLSYENLMEGRLIHACILGSELGLEIEADAIIGTALVKMYSKCGSFDDSVRMFSRMENLDDVAWTVVIAAYIQNSLFEDVFYLFQQMLFENVKLSTVSFLPILNACSISGKLYKGKLVHAHVMDRGFMSDDIVGTAVVDMYGKSGSLEAAHCVFQRIVERSVVSWNSMIAAYAQCYHGSELIDLIAKMQLEHLKPDKITLITVLSKCSSLAECKLIHTYGIEYQLELNVILATALVDIYGKCGSLEDARHVFDRVPVRDVVTWNAMVGAYSLHGCVEALDMFYQMEEEGFQQDKATYVAGLDACANLIALEEGRSIHMRIMKTDFETDVVVKTAVVNMYGRCGRLEEARIIFNEMSGANVVSWTAIIAAYAQHGYACEVLQLFQEMQGKGILPNAITFVCALSACSHAGLVDQGAHFFISIGGGHGIIMTTDHSACIIDILGRAGKINEAEDFVNMMSLVPDLLVWKTLLGACRIHGDMECGRRAAEHAFKLDPYDDATYVLPLSIYAAAQTM